MYGSPVKGQKNCVSSGKNAKLYGLISFLNLLSKYETVSTLSKVVSSTIP